MWTLGLVQFALIFCHSLVHCHLPSYVSTPSNKIEQFCMLAETCLHDTIPVCGTMGAEKREFLDICDMLEFACDTNQIYSHVDDMPDCPNFNKGKGMG